MENYDKVYNTIWMVSNCNQTSGAAKRFEYGQALIAAGLKVFIKKFPFDLENNSKNKK